MNSFLFLVPMYLLTLALGYATALEASTRVLWESIREEGMPGHLQVALMPSWGRTLLYATYSSSAIGLLCSFLSFGPLPGAGISFCFIVATKTFQHLLLNKIHNTFHLNIILNAVLRKQADSLRAGNAAHARFLQRLCKKVWLKLYALKVANCATMVPAYDDGRLEHLKVPGAKADSYHRCSRQEKGQ